MTKKKPKPPWWSPRRWVKTALPSGAWTSRRQWLMQTGSALLMVLLGWMLNREHPAPRTQQLQTDGEVVPRGEVTLRKIPAADSLPVQVHDVATVVGVNPRVATATATNANTNAIQK